MKFQFAITALFALIFNLVCAQDIGGIYFTNPVAGAIYTASTSQIISWKLTNYAVTEIESLELRHGDAANLELIQIINKNPIPVNLNQYVWDIPANVTTDSSYVLMAKDSFGYSYSAYFTIHGLNNNNNIINATATLSAQPTLQTLVARDSIDTKISSNTISMKASTAGLAITLGVAFIFV